MPPPFDPRFQNDALNLIIAVVLGGAIGFERQWRQRLAGLRTNTLVSLGAAIFVVFESQFTDTSPTRVAAQVVTGIGFLGAGMIWKEGVNVRGLNTAATLGVPARSDCLPAPAIGAAPSSPPGSSQASTSCSGRWSD
jgi:putative Mg2+ transporter-C (MgtC) family protein